MSVSSNSSGNSLVDQGISNIGKTYQEALAAIQHYETEMQKYASEIGYDNSHINAQTKHADYHHHCFPGGGNYTTVTYHWTNKYSATQIAQWKADETKVNSQKNNATDAFNKTMEALDIHIGELENVLNSAFDDLDNEGENAKKDGDNISDAYKKIEGYIHQIISAFAKQMEQNLLAAKSQNDTDPKDLLADALAGIRAGIGMGSILSTLDSQMRKDLTQYHEDDKQAETDNIGNDREEEFDAQSRMHNAADMMTLITNLEDQISPIMASMDPGMAQLSATLEEIIKKVIEILHDKNLSPTAKRDELMSLFVIVMGLLSIVQQYASKDKAQSEKTMSEATQDAAQMGIADMQAQEKKLEQALAYAATMGVIMKIAEFTIGIAMAAMTGGVAGAVMAAFVVTDSATGAFTGSSLSDRLASACGGGIEGAAFAAAIEMVGTAGGAVLLKAAAKVAMKAAVAAVLVIINTMMEQGLRSSIEVAAKQVAEAIGKEGEEATMKAAEKTIEKTAAESATKAATKSFEMYFRQNGFALIGQWIKEAATNGINGAGSRMAAQVMETAARDAAEAAVKESANMMTLLGKVAEFTEEEAASFTGLSTEIGDTAAAKVANTDVATVAKLNDVTIFGKTIVSDVKGGVGYSLVGGATVGALYGIGSAQVLTQMLEELKKEGKISDDTFKTWNTVLQVLQQVMVMIAALEGTGVMDQVNMAGSSAAMQTISSIMTKIGNLFTTFGMGAEVSSNFGQYDANQKEAEPLERIAAIQSTLDLLNNFNQQEINKREKSEEKKDTEDSTQSTQSTASLASHLWDYMNTASHVLAV